MDVRTKAKHIRNLEKALQIFKGNRHVVKGSSVTAILEDGAIAWAMLNHEANREDAFCLAYESGRRDGIEQVAYLNFSKAKVHDFPNIERGLPLDEVVGE